MRKYFLAILTLLTFAACEQTVEGPDWPAHDEKLVVTSFLRLEHDSIFAYARVNRTLPLSERFDMQKAMVNDAVLQVTSGGRSFPIDFDPGFFPFDYDFNYHAVAARGSDDAFTLSVRHGSKTASATVLVKAAAIRFTDLRVERSSTGYEEYIIHYSIPAPGQDTDISCGIEYWDPNMGGWYEMYSVTLPNLANRPNGMLEGSFPIWSFERPGSTHRIRLILTVRNRAYQDYSNSRWQWNTGDSPFDPPQKNPPFNVTGDGFGFFWYEIVGEPVEIEY
jgi:hypothetical protein